ALSKPHRPDKDPVAFLLSRRGRRACVAQYDGAPERTIQRTRRHLRRLSPAYSECHSRLRHERACRGTGGQPRGTSREAGRQLSTLTLPDGLDRHPCQLIGAFVLDGAGMALEPMPFDGVALRGLVQALPQLDVLDGFLVGRFPATAPPPMNPFHDAVAEIVRDRR